VGNGCKWNETVLFFVAHQPATATSHVQEPTVDMAAVEAADVHVLADVSAEHGVIGHEHLTSPEGREALYPAQPTRWWIVTAWGRSV
jgi:hypothetical protein